MCGPEQFAHAGTSFDPVASIIVVRALRGDSADLLVRAGGGAATARTARFLVWPFQLASINVLK